MLEKPIYLKINSPKLFIYWTLHCGEFFVFSLIAQAGRPIPLSTPKKGTQMFSFSSTKYGNVVIYLEKTLQLKRLSFQFPQKNLCLLQFIFRIHFSRLNFVSLLKTEIYTIKLGVLAVEGYFLCLHWVGAGSRAFSVYFVKDAIRLAVGWVIWSSRVQHRVTGEWIPGAQVSIIWIRLFVPLSKERDKRMYIVSVLCKRLGYRFLDLY